MRAPLAAALALLAAAPAAAAVAPSKPPAAGAPADDAKPSGAANATEAVVPEAAPAEAPDEARAPKRTGPQSGSWRLSLPAWLTASGLPVWTWGLLGLLGFLLLRGLFRRDDRRDLVGPPTSYRIAPRPPTPAARLPDPPQRP